MARNLSTQSTIQHRTFEALLPFDDGCAHILGWTEQSRNLVRRGFLCDNGEGIHSITMLGRRVLAEYRERHGIA